MNRRRFKILILIALIIGCPPAMVTPGASAKQKPPQKLEQKTTSQQSQKVEKTKTEQSLKTEQKTKVEQKPAQPAPRGPAASSQAGQVTLRLERGGKVTVSNRVGRIVITGSDRDTVQATASSEAGSEPVQVEVGGESTRTRIILSIPALEARRAGKEINLSVKVPRYADVEVAESHRGTVDVSDIDGGVVINGGTGAVTVMRVGILRVSRRGGNITARNIKSNLLARVHNGHVLAEEIGGQVDVAATSGNVTVRNAGGDLRANSATGDIQAYCVNGRADVNSASGVVLLVGITSDTDASSTSGDVIFRGTVRANGRYNLKSISGQVQMAIQPDAPGFTATLITYTGEIETDFPLKADSPPQSGRVNRRVTGRYGDGQAQFMLDSFSGGVKITKIASDVLKVCK